MQKKFSRKQTIRSGKYISFMGNDYTKTTGDCVLEHYDTEEYNKTIVITWPIGDIHDENIPYNESGYIDLIKLHDTYDKIILYDMEHTGAWVMPWICDEFLNNIDEIWTPWLESVGAFGDNQRHKVKFMPLRYCKTLEDNYIGTMMNPHFDLGFLGTLAPSMYDIIQPDPSTRYRMLVIKSITDDVSQYVISGSTFNNAAHIIRDTKFMLDMSQRLWPTLYSQNVLRIMEMISLGKHVITEKSSFNYFPEMVTVIDDLMQDLKPFVLESDIQDHSRDFKDLTYSDSSYSNYIKNCISRYTEEYWDPWNVYGWMPIENKLYYKYAEQTRPNSTVN